MRLKTLLYCLLQKRWQGLWQLLFPLLDPIPILTNSKTCKIDGWEGDLGSRNSSLYILVERKKFPKDGLQHVSESLED